MPEVPTHQTAVEVVREVWDDPAAGVAQDDIVLTASGQDGRPRLRLWYNAHCIVLGRGYARRLPRPVSSVGGLPVLVRASGGEIVLHGPGVLNISLAVPTDLWNGSIEEMFAGLSTGVAYALRADGYAVTVGMVPGSYCPGDYDVSVADRKVMGISQRRTRDALMVHGSLNLYIVPEIYAYALERFYRAAGIDNTADPGLIGSVFDHEPDAVELGRLEQALVGSLLAVWSDMTGTQWVTV